MIAQWAKHLACMQSTPIQFPAPIWSPQHLWELITKLKARSNPWRPSDVAQNRKNKSSSQSNIFLSFLCISYKLMWIRKEQELSHVLLDHQKALVYCIHHSFLNYISWKHCVLENNLLRVNSAFVYKKQVIDSNKPLFSRDLLLSVLVRQRQHVKLIV